MIRRRARALMALLVPAALAVGACSERLDTAASCPLLCPGQQLDVIDSVIDLPLAFDTTLGAYPFIGDENPLILAKRGDSLDLRVIIRFDTLVRDYTPVGGTTLVPIADVDSAYLLVKLIKGAHPLPVDFSIEAYEVSDPTAADSIPSLLLPHFTAARLLGTLAFTDTTFVDSSVVQIPLDSAQIRAILQDPVRTLRVGLRVVSAEAVELLMTTALDLVEGPTFDFKPALDSGTRIISIIPSSLTPPSPPEPPGLSSNFVDYQLVAAAPDHRSAGRFFVGGQPGHRSYLRFDLPRWLTDSVYVLRARLELTQDPIYGMDEGDTVIVRLHMALGGNALTDLNRAVAVLAPSNAFTPDSIVRTPADSGLAVVEINTAVRQWRTVDGVRPFPSALILRTAVEGRFARGIRFFGNGAPQPALRPRLVVSYVPNVTYGRP
jgi:hypothetical protein